MNKKSSLTVGTRVSFEARHGEVIGEIVECDDSSIVVVSNLDHSHRYRIPYEYALKGDSTLRIRKAVRRQPATP